MSRMRAVLVDPDAPGRLSLGTIERPVVLPNQALIRVAAFSLNRGEVRRAASAASGAVIGWDLAGTVEESAVDGSGPPVGARVVAMRPTGAWAEYVAVETNRCAELPDGVSFAQAATLPVAGLTALRALEKGGLLLERRVLITGASGGVGQFACQIASDAGAFVVGSVRQDRSVAVAREAGAHEVVASDDLSPAREYGPYHLVVETVGGGSLATALTMLARDATCVSLGVSGGAEATINVGGFYLTGGASLYGFILFYEDEKMPVGPDLGRLVRLVAQGKLKTPISLEDTWDHVGETAQKLIERQYTGKAVLHVK
jgi:NADPH:quinone reductase